jgi:hypothetical protein
LFSGVDCSEEAVAGLAQLNELLEAEMNFITSGIYGYRTVDQRVSVP